MKTAPFIAVASFLWTGCGSEPTFPAGPDTPKTPATIVTTQTDSPLLKIIAVNVGEGDATTVILPNHEALLIDCGPEGSKTAVQKVLEDNAVESLKAIFVSHHHADHEGACPAIALQWPPVLGIFAREQIQPGDLFDWDGLSIDILAVGGILASGLDLRDSNTDENSLSEALLLHFGNFTYFTAGDLTGGGGGPKFPTTDIETELSPLVGDIDVLHVSHHGSHTSTNENFLNGITPEAAIISFGANNDYHHPHPSVVARLQRQDIEIWETIDGNITITTDGEDYEITSARQ